MKKALILWMLFACFIFTSSAWATIYRWVDEKGVANFSDDYDRVPAAYRDKVEEVKVAKAGPSIPSQALPGNTAAAARQEEAVKQSPPIGQTLVREGDFAVKLAEALKMGSPKGEAEAESMLAAAGIMPKNGWIADYPMTPDIIGELQNTVGSAVDSGKLKMNRDDATRAVQDLAAQQGLPVRVDERQSPAEQQPQDYGESELVNNYYDTEGPPVVTYYPPPWDYYYLYAWVPYPFWYTGFWFPGFFILTDFHCHHGHDHHGHDHFVSNHFVDPKTHASLRIDPRTRATGGAARTVASTVSKGFSSPEAMKGASSIFNRSTNGRTSSQPANTGRQYTGRQYRTSQRSSAGSGRYFSGRNYGTPSNRSYSAASKGGRSFYGGSRSGGYSGSFRSGGGSGSSGGSHGGSLGGGHGGGFGGGHR